MKFSRSAAIAALVLSVCSIRASSASAQSSGTPVSWTGAVNVSIGTGTISKVAGCDSCPDAGAVSSARLTGNGFVEFVPVFGGREVVGLGRDLSSATAWTIDHAFSFWPGGTWEIRESGLYRGEGRMVAGDRFRVVVQNGAILYQQNGVTVHQTAAQPVFPLALDTALFSIGSGISAGQLAAGDVPTSVVLPPTTPEPTPTPAPAPGVVETDGYFTAITDRVARPEPKLPSLPAAGSSVVDPTFQSRITRMTDRNTRPGRLDRSYRTPSSAHQHSWSAGGSYFYVMSTDGTVVPFTFDQITGEAARINPSSTGDGGLTIQSFLEPQFSYVSDNLLYGSYSGSGATLRTIDQYDFKTGIYSRLLDVDTLAPNLAGTYVGWVGSSAGPIERIATFFGGTSQDRHYLAVVFDKNDPSRRRVINTKASTIDGKPTNIPLNFSLHAMGIDRSGRYAMLYTTWTDMAEPRKAAPSYLWDIDSGHITELPMITGRNGGHDAYGYGVRVNQYCCTATPYDAAQWQFRSLDNPFATRDVIPTVVTPKEVFLADHNSWHNARPDMLVPFISGLFRTAPEDVAWRPWDEEIVGVKPDAAPGTLGTVWRFAHHRSDVRSDTDPTRTTFWYQPRPSVSDDGGWVLFTSNWEKSLGIDPGGDATATHRQDVFLVRLQAQSLPAPQPQPEPQPTVTPLSIVPVTLQSAVRRKAYSATLAAANANGAVTWTISSGALPGGFTLHASTGVISGTSDKPGNWTFTVTARDAGGTASLPLSIQVKAR